MQGLGTSLIASLIKADSVNEFLNLSLKKEFFRGTEIELYDFVETHVAKHGTLPKGPTVKQETGQALQNPPEPSSYYMEKVEARYIQSTVKLQIAKASDELKKQNPYGALELFNEMVLDLMLSQKRNEIVNFTQQAYDLVKDDYVQKNLLGDEFGILTGWPYLDNMCHGLVGGDVLSIVGRPGLGKTYLMLNMAHHAWHHQNKTVLAVSMEMKPLPLIHRVAAMHTNVPVKHIKAGHLPEKSLFSKTSFYDKVFDGLKEIQIPDKPPFWIIDGNLTATVEDIMLLARQLKPDAVYVDGAYMLQTNDRGPRWERVAATTEALKQRISTDLNIPVAASYQFNRESEKAGKNKTGLEHIAGADVIGQISSIVLALFDDENIETKIRKRVELIKGRSGEVGGFNINWKFEQPPFMDFSQIEEQKKATMA